MTELVKTEIHDTIAAANKVFMDAFRRGDAAGLAVLYTENCVLMPPNSDFVKGKDAVQAFWQGAFDMGIKAAVMEIVEVEGHGDTAIEVSQYTLYVADEQVADKGKYIVIWKRVAGEWKLHQDIYNSSMPPPG